MSVIKQSSTSSIISDTIYCKKCDKYFPIERLESFISVESKDEISWKCSTCKEEHKDKLELGCTFCRKNFWILSGLLGNNIECPHCKTKLQLPSSTNWDEENNKLKEGFKLTVFPSSGDSAIYYSNLNDLADDITNNKVKGSDLCNTFEYSPIRSLKEVCNRHFSLRKLYDPIGAYSPKVGKIVGSIFLVIYLTVWLIGGIMKLGTPFLLYALFGILAVGLTPTVIGVFIVYFIARSVGVHLIYPYLGVLLVGFTSAASFGIGYGLGYGVMRLLSKIIRLKNTRPF
jgi:uncharacterized protein YbaR (Trm112 family)